MKLCYFGKITTLFLSKKSHIAVKFLKTISTTMCLHQCWTSTFQHYVEEDVRTEVPVYHQISVPVHLVSMDQIAVRVRKLRKTSRRTYIVTHCKQVTAVLTLKLACFQGCVKVIARMVECVPMATHAFVLKIHMERDASFVSHHTLLYVPLYIWNDFW